MKVAREEIVARARPRAFRLMVVMTDAVVNLPTSSSVGKPMVVAEANAAAGVKIKCFKISVGVLADTALMPQVADITGGVHFSVPGGQTIAGVRTLLEAAFRQIASSRPLRLVDGD